MRSIQILTSIDRLDLSICKSRFQVDIPPETNSLHLNNATKRHCISGHRRCLRDKENQGVLGSAYKFGFCIFAVHAADCLKNSKFTKLLNSCCHNQQLDKTTDSEKSALYRYVIADGDVDTEFRRYY